MRSTLALVPVRAALTKATRGEAPSYVTLEEVKAALDQLSLAGKPRVRAFLRGLWLTGARVSELLAARVEHVDFGGKAITLKTMKRRKPTTRGLPLPPDYLGELAVLVNECHLKSSDLLFPWSRSRAFELIRDALVSAGVDRRRSHPHVLRHGHAVHAIRNHVPLNVVQRALGHASITTTSVYLEVTGEDVRAAYGKMEW